MYKIVVFCEDFAHEEFSKAIINKLLNEYNIQSSLDVLSGTGGHGKVETELRDFFRDITKGIISLPDLILVLIDCNCNKYKEYKRIVNKIIPNNYQTFTILGMPDPHIEKWLLVDAEAFKKTFGKGCTIPIKKCGRDYYKELLREEIRKNGIKPLIDGIEYTDDIVNNMDFNNLRREKSLDSLLRDLKNEFKRWK